MRTLTLSTLALLLSAAAVGLSARGGLAAPPDAITGATDPVGQTSTLRDIEVAAFRQLTTRGAVTLTLTQQAGTPHVAYSAPAGSADSLSVTCSDGHLLLTTAADKSASDRPVIEVTVYTPTPPEVVELQGTGDFKASDLRSDRPFTLVSQGTGDTHLGHVACAALDIQFRGTGDCSWNKAEVTGRAVLASAGTGRLKGSYLRCATLSASQRGTGSLSLATLEADDSVSLQCSHSELKVSRVEAGGTLRAAASEDGRLALPRLTAAALVATTHDEAGLTADGKVSGPARLECNSRSKLDVRRLDVGGELTTGGSTPGNLLLRK